MQAHVDVRLVFVQVRVVVGEHFAILSGDQNEYSMIIIKVSVEQEDSSGNRQTFPALRDCRQ
jgi:hypothetical protein